MSSILRPTFLSTTSFTQYSDCAAALKICPSALDSRCLGQGVCINVEYSESFRNSKSLVCLTSCSPGQIHLAKSIASDDRRRSLVRTWVGNTGRQGRAERCTERSSRHVCSATYCEDGCTGIDVWPLVGICRVFYYVTAGESNCWTIASFSSRRSSARRTKRTMSGLYPDVASRTVKIVNVLIAQAISGGNCANFTEVASNALKWSGPRIATAAKVTYVTLQSAS